MVSRVSITWDDKGVPVFREQHILRFERSVIIQDFDAITIRMTIAADLRIRC